MHSRFCPGRSSLPPEQQNGIFLSCVLGLSTAISDFLRKTAESYTDVNAVKTLLTLGAQ